jgi:hypothetical protein
MTSRKEGIGHIVARTTNTTKPLTRVGERWKRTVDEMEMEEIRHECKGWLELVQVSERVR